MNPDPIVELQQVRFTYPGQRQPALRDVTLGIAGAALTALLGPNGAGKTTLLHGIVGLCRPQQGEIRLAGRPSGQYSRREMGRLVGLVPQVEYTPFDFSVVDLVLLGRAPYLQPLEAPEEADLRTALAALEAAGAAHLAGRTVNALSGGERQLVSIARALAQQPRILLLDEPTAHLDLANRGRLLRLLRTLADGGITVVFSTQDPQAASDAADMAVLMRAGEIVVAGAVRTVLTAEHLSATYGVPVLVREVEGRPLVWAE